MAPNRDRFELRAIGESGTVCRSRKTDRLQCRHPRKLDIGVFSGAFMAVQFGTAWSSVIKGVGVIAG
ncbi:MAG: hypothetical protein Q7J60_19305, partial [Bradyrhizobium sp.]|nr:hypothetical protein [Bradyrhizobium sp.]